MVQQVKMEKLFLSMELWGWYNKYKSESTHIYGEKGTYTVELTVKDSRGKESIEQTKVTVKQDPQTGGSL